MKTRILLMRVPFKVKRQIIFERDLVRARGDAATLTGADRYNAARRVERLQDQRAVLYA
jgi:hypothetical protein